MTFNTTSLPLWHALQRKLVLERAPLKALGEQKRHVLLEPRIDALLDGQIEFGVFPAWSAERLIAQFSAGWLIKASRKKTKLRPDIERIEGHDEVWALCARIPKPGWRILGRFYEKDLFIGLRAWDKHALITRYEQATQEVIADWNDLFGDQDPLHGNDVSDYMSMCEDIDEPL